ncbi:PEP-CTERM motif protein [Planctomycetes bacterium K23_9]|uniref:PEP-CTERM motif protein n=2 Tax=Stieleria marina TaxID=1930275 RepID=A0A517P0J6_9BACT|nr:PEP-CTERM motif protein [Planctomycetes bacterium K23_9]
MGGAELALDGGTAEAGIITGNFNKVNQANIFNIQKIATICITGLLLMAAGNVCSAAVITYTDRTAFEADATTAGILLTTEGFSADPGTPFTISNANGGAEFTLANGGYSVIGEDLSDSVSGGGTARVRLTGSPTGDLVAIGYDFRGSAFNSDGLFAGLMDVNGSTHGVSVPAHQDRFVGMIFDGGDTINTIASLEATGEWVAGAPFGAVGIGFDNLTIGTLSTTAVPEPSSLAILALGAGGLAMFRRKRKPAQAAEQTA